MEYLVDELPYREMGKRLKEFRLALPAKYTQVTLSEALGITQGTYSLYECGQRSISKSVKVVLEEKFSLNLVWLETGKGTMFLEDVSATMNNLFTKLNEDNQKYILDMIKKTFIAQEHMEEYEHL